MSKIILLSHGGGGRLMNNLINDNGSIKYHSLKDH